MGFGVKIDEMNVHKFWKKPIKEDGDLAVMHVTDKGANWQLKGITKVQLPNSDVYLVRTLSFQYFKFDM